MPYNGLIMKPEPKRIWLEALRSGNFRQAEGYLKINMERRDNKGRKIGYCCLGVFSEAMSIKSVSPSDRLSPGGDEYSFKFGSEAREEFPDWKWFADQFETVEQMGENEKLYRVEKIGQLLAGKNDDKKRFKVIADWIDRNL